MSSTPLPYLLLDSGDQKRLERFGSYTLSRPCSQAIWKKTLDESIWKQADAEFTREGGEQWKLRTRLPSSWLMTLQDLIFKIAPTDFGHVGIFPEHSYHWPWMQKLVKQRKLQQPEVHILNLFAYSGGATLALAKAGASVCHVDASKTTVAWARENAALNHLETAPVRWIIDDVHKFLSREVKRGRLYDGIILDPPSFGRGPSGQVFTIEKDIQDLLKVCSSLLSKNPLFLFFSCHSAGFTPTSMHNLVNQLSITHGKIEVGEMIIPQEHSLSLPSGSYARWLHE